MERCKTCHEWQWGVSHRCPPAWEAKLHGSDERSEIVHAQDLDEAAEKFISERCMEAGESFEDGGHFDVVVRPVGGSDETAKVFRINMSLEWAFNAHCSEGEALTEFDPEDVY